MAGPQYSGTIPQIAQAYENDPRTRLAASMLQSGMSGTPVAQGKWAYADGLARAAQALAGAFVQRGNQRRFAGREGAYVKGMQTAAGLEPLQDKSWLNPAAANPATQNPGVDAMANAAQALNVPTSPPLDMSGQGVGPVPQAPSPQSLLPPTRPQAPVAPVAPPQQQLSAHDYYTRGIVPSEGGTNSDGAFRTSPKGAVGPGQVMPGTGPEAARLAGLPWDDNKYRTDPAYNNALGEAYYTKQLQDFGDPVLAAAAYNAGPGRVRRALRRGGQNWEQYVPAETRTYLNGDGENYPGFRARISSTSQTGGVSPTVQPPSMEAVPEAPQAPAQMPQAPALPQPARNRQLEVAQRMLRTGNPDLMSIAQSYLDKGLEADSQYALQRNSQEFQQGQTGYGAALDNYTGAQGDARRAGYNERSSAQQRNFEREQTYGNQRFTQGENAADRTFQRETREDTQEFQRGESVLDRANALAQTNQRTTGRNPFLDTAQGVKLQQDMQAEVNNNTDIMTNVQRFLDLNERQQTGGFILGTSPGRALAGMNDAEIKEMTGLANEIVIGKLGGLGVAISDGDRNFVSDSMQSASSPRITNINRGQTILGVLARKNDYSYQWQLAQMEDRATTFHREWKQYIDSTPVIRSVAGGMVQANSMTFDQWRASRPQYDRDGNPVTPSGGTPWYGTGGR